MKMDSVREINPDPSVLPQTDRSAESSFPVIAPNPIRLSQHIASLQAIEDSGIFTNYGPTNSQLEQSLITTMFGTGHCVTVCNATIGIMLSIRDVIETSHTKIRRFALMPSFTFAAGAHAALWNGLSPLFCDIDPETWLPCAISEERLLERYGEEIAVIVPYATFGNNLDLDRYQRLSEKYGVPIVVDAAASLGSLDQLGRSFGTDFRWPLIYSMHATKSFCVGEGGVIYCADEQRIDRLRAMGNFGFETPRIASRIGLNAKMAEITALSALLHLDTFSQRVTRRKCLATVYNEQLSGYQFQKSLGSRQAYAFQSVLLPPEIAVYRKDVMAALLTKGVGSATYFSPHLAEQSFFQSCSVSDVLPVTSDISRRILTLPISDSMSDSDVYSVSAAVVDCCREKGWSIEEQH